MAITGRDTVQKSIVYGEKRIEDRIAGRLRKDRGQSPTLDTDHSTR